MHAIIRSVTPGFLEPIDRKKKVARGTQWHHAKKPSLYTGRKREYAEMSQYLHARFASMPEPYFKKVCKAIVEADYESQPLPPAVLDALAELPTDATDIRDFVPYSVYVALQQVADSELRDDLDNICLALETSLGVETVLRVRNVSKLTASSVPKRYRSRLREQLYGNLHPLKEGLVDRVSEDVWNKLKLLYPPRP